MHRLLASVTLALPSSAQVSVSGRARPSFEESGMAGKVVVGG